MVKNIVQKVLTIIIETSLDHERKIKLLEEKVARLDTQNNYWLELFRDIEGKVNSGQCDQQQIAVAIKRWRHTLEREDLLTSKIESGLVRE